MGCGTDFEQNFTAACEAALQCNQDSTLFVNESEAVLAAFTKALNKLKIQKFGDEVRILDAVTEKEAVVHFLMDCVRNRLTFRRMVGKAKDQLCERSPAWSQAFQTHLRRCPTCKTVEFDCPPLEQSTPVEPSIEVKRPIPFVIEMLAAMAVALPVLATLQSTNCWERWMLAALGACMVLPLLLVLYILCRHGKASTVARFLPGSYIVKTAATSRRLGLLWAPSRSDVFIKMPTTSSTNEEQRDPGRCRTFGWWSSWPTPQPGATLERIGLAASAGPLVGDSTGMPPASASTEACRVRSMALSGSNQVVLMADSTLAGWPVEAQRASFDGSVLSIVQGPRRSSARRTQGAVEGELLEVWLKSGLWRWDFILKVVLLLAVLGCAAFLAAVLVPPGLDLQCLRAAIPRHLPLKAVFLLDGSASIEPTGWESEKKATEQLSMAFRDAYAQVGQKNAVNLGIVQFCVEAQVEVPITNQQDVIQAGLDKMSQMRSGTNFGNALQLCSSMLANYTKAGETFDLCILITDGETDEDAQSLRRLVSDDTAIFGVYVGHNTASEAELRSVSKCGAADPSPSCHFFAAATDFKELGRLAGNIAERVVSGSGTAKTQAHGRPELLWLLFGVFPFVFWWVYLQLPYRRNTTSTGTELAGAEVRAPLRLRAAGMNEGRPP